MIYNPPRSPSSNPNSVRTPHVRQYLYYETRILFSTLLAGFPGSLIALLLIWSGEYSFKLQLTVTLFVMLFWFGFSFAVRERIVTTMRTISSLLAAYHEGDYSMRSVRGAGDDVLQEVAREINALGDTLRVQRISAMESTTLLRKVMDEIDVAILAFDDQQKLRLFNNRAQQLFDTPDSALQGRIADELGLGGVLEGESPRILELSLPGGLGRWELRRGEFRLQGQSHQLVVLSDLTRALRSEEHQAWKRLVQVLRHEINNSLAPIHSLADSLRNLLSRDPRPDDWEDDVVQGLNVITGRSEGLNRFMASYAQLTKLPKPDLKTINVAEWIQSIVNLEPNPRVSLITGSSITIKADSAQLDQVLINLIKNAIEAVQETGGDVRVGWLTQTKKNRCLIIFVEDQGIGISNPDNLFVPFFTTKPQGSGLGLMISRQIAEAHGGTLILENRIDDPGCIAKLSLPI